MSEKYKAKNPDGLYFITLTVIDWVDLFIRPSYKHILIESLQFCQKNKDLRIFAYVIMSSHLHFKQIKRNNHYKIWTDGYHPIELDNENIIRQKLNYVHNNPVEHEIVIEPVDYKYSSAKNYAGEKGELEVEIL